MATGNCPGDNTEKTAAAKAKVRTDIKGCLYPRQAGLSVRASGSEVTRPFTVFMGQTGRCPHVSESGLADNPEGFFFFWLTVFSNLRFQNSQSPSNACSHRCTQECSLEAYT